MTTVDATAEQILTMLQAIPNLLVYDAVVPATPPKDEAGKVKPYAVLYMGGGQVQPSDRLAWAASDLGISFQITCAAGTPRGCRWAVDKVRAKFTGHYVVAGPANGRAKEVTDPGGMRREDSIPNDLRWFVPLLFRITTTT